jgi:hypothetical protein
LIHIALVLADRKHEAVVGTGVPQVLVGSSSADLPLRGIVDVN